MIDLLVLLVFGLQWPPVDGRLPNQYRVESTFTYATYWPTTRNEKIRKRGVLCRQADGRVRIDGWHFYDTVNVEDDYTVWVGQWREASRYNYVIYTPTTPDPLTLCEPNAKLRQVKPGIDVRNVIVMTGPSYGISIGSGKIYRDAYSERERRWQDLEQIISVGIR